MLNQRNTVPTDYELRVFAGSVVPLCAVAVVWLLWQRLGHPGLALVVVVLAIVLSTIGLARPALLRSVYAGWMALTRPMGWIVGLVMLGMVFFLVVTPIGLVMHLLRRDPLKRQFDSAAESYWQPCRTVDDNARYFEQF